MATITDSDVITLVEDLPGFAGLQRFSLDAIDDAGVLYSLRAIDEPGLRFVLTPAHAFFPGYQPVLGIDVVTALGGLERDVEVDVYLVLTLGTGLADATANLRAPFVVARDTSLAMQAVLDDESWPMHAPLLP